MTQVLAAITEEFAFMVADRRLTWGTGPRAGKVKSESECKLVVLCYVNTIGYTGLASLGGMPTHEWIATALAGGNCFHAHEAADMLAREAQVALPALPPAKRRHAFLISGWTHQPDNIGKTHLCLVSNFHDVQWRPLSLAQPAFRTMTRTLSVAGSAAAFAIGEPLRGKRETALVRSIGRSLRRGGDPRSIVRLLVEEVFHTSGSSATVGDHVQACCVPLASARQLWSTGSARLSGLPARTDRTTFSYWDRKFNEHLQYGPTTVCGGQAFSDMKYTRSRTGPDQEASIRALTGSKP